MKMKEQKNEYRDAELAIASLPEESKEDPGQWVEGTAVLFGMPSVIYTDKDTGIEYSEVIEKGACDGVDLSDVLMRYNHDDNYAVLARGSNGTMVVTVDDVGVHVKANIAPTQQGTDIYQLIKRGDIHNMSMGFVVAKEWYDYDTHTRHITQLKRVIEISAVDKPAYANTSLSVAQRSIEAAEAEHKERENERQRIYIMTLI